MCEKIVGVTRTPVEMAELVNLWYRLNKYGESIIKLEYKRYKAENEQVTAALVMSMDQRINAMLNKSVKPYYDTNSMVDMTEKNGVAPLGSKSKMPNSKTAKGTSEAVETFVDQMDPARYERYWKQDYKDVYKRQPNTRQRQYTAPGTRSITDQKINNKTGNLYDRQTIYDEYGRRIGNNDFTDHGRPDVPTHTNPHYHPNPWINPNQHGPGTPGLHPETPRW